MLREGLLYYRHMGRTLVALAALLFAVRADAETSAYAWGPNDLSILLPLPASAADESLPRMSDRGAAGTLFPRELYDLLPALHPGEGRALYGKMRVVGARLDPCFPARPPRDGCAPQLRLVWQPLVAGSRGGVTTLDAAVHTSYELNHPEFSRLLTELASLNARHADPGGGTLGVNPRLRRLGLDSVYGRDLRSLLLARLGATRLSRVTFAQRVDDGRVWVFGGLDVDGGRVRRVNIPRVGSVFQAFVNRARDGRAFDGGLSPSPSATPALGALLRDSAAAEREGKFALAQGEAGLLQDPRHGNIHTVDCLSCHLAQPAEDFVARRSTGSFAGPVSLRAFGYDGDAPAANRRVAAETALALEQVRVWLAQ